MSNPHNLIQPPRLNLDGLADALPTLEPPVNGNHNESNNAPNYELLQTISRVVEETLRTQGRQMFSALLNPASDIGDEVDVPVNISNNENLSEMDRIPDVVKSLRTFSGEPGEFSSWRKSVDRILHIYDHLRGTPKYYGILSVIRNKIVGNADIALESYNTPLNWTKISKCLNLHYADKRDLGTLEYQMTTLVQGANTVSQFYQEVYNHLSLILNKLGSIEMSQDAMNIMTQSYREKALDTFIRGLKGDLPRLLSIREPADLPQALHLCFKLQNMDYRAQYANNSSTNPRKVLHNTPPLVPPRRMMSIPSRQAPIPAPRRDFHPQLVHNPQVPQRPRFYSQGYQQPQHEAPQNKLPPPRPPRGPVPMDVDQSIRSHAINYANRPQNQRWLPKRPQQASQRHHPPPKIQRVYYTEPDETNDVTEEQYEQDMNQEDLNYDQTLTDYVDTSDEPSIDQSEQLDDIYFLD